MRVHARGVDGFLGSVLPKPNLNPATPPAGSMGGMGPAGMGPSAAAAPAASVAKPTTPKIVIQHSAGQLFVHSVQHQMLKVYDLGLDGMPKDLQDYKVKLATTCRLTHAGVRVYWRACA